MSIADQITRLNNAKAAIKQSIINKGVTVSDKALLDEYPALIDSIEVGSGGEGGGDPFYEEFYNMKTDNGTSFYNLFYGYNGTELDVSKFKTNNVSNMSSMFTNCSQLQTIIGISDMNVSNVNNIDQMFRDCVSLTSLDVNNWDTGKVTSMLQVFCNCSSLQTLNLSNWDIHNVPSIDTMFQGCYQLQSLDVTGWDTSNVTNMYGLFYYDYSLQNIIGIESWDTSKVENMNDMFYSCNALQSLDLSGWDVSNVPNMNNMFAYMQSSSLPKLDLSNFNTKKLTSAYGMFSWCIYLQELDIRNFELVHEDGTMAEIGSMLDGCTSLHTLRLDNCNTDTISKIINESGMPQEPAYVNGEYVTRKIYCKAEATREISLPPGWGWEIVE